MAYALSRRLQKNLENDTDVYRPTAEDLYAMYALAGYYANCWETEDDMTVSKNIEPEVNPEVLRIGRKAVSRNRHHASVKAKKRAKKSAEILERRYLKGDFRLPYEEYRLCTKANAAIKKANRVKVS